jgi:hypothetical protein
MSVVDSSTQHNTANSHDSLDSHNRTDRHDTTDSHNAADSHDSANFSLFNFGEAPNPHDAASHSTAPSSYDAAPHGGASAHHGGSHCDPAILALQQRLLDAGFDPGAVDGIMGPHTEAALAAEQAAYAHLQQDGYGQYEAHHHHAEHAHSGHAGHHQGGYEEHQYHHGEQEHYGHAGHHQGGYEEHQHHHAEHEHYMNVEHVVEVERYEELYPADPAEAAPFEEVQYDQYLAEVEEEAQAPTW